MPRAWLQTVQCRLCFRRHARGCTWRPCLHYAAARAVLGYLCCRSRVFHLHTGTGRNSTCTKYSKLWLYDRGWLSIVDVRLKRVVILPKIKAGTTFTCVDQLGFLPRSLRLRWAWWWVRLLFDPSDGREDVATSALQGSAFATPNILLASHHCAQLRAFQRGKLVDFPHHPYL